MIDLDRLRERLERCNEEEAREYYLHGAGLKQELAVGPILDTYADAYTPDTVAAVRRAWATAGGEEQTRLRFLYQNVAGNLIGQRVASLRDRIGTEESSRTVTFDGQTITFPAASVRVSQEPTRARRHALEDARLRVVSEMNPLYAQAHAIAWQVIAEQLDPAGYVTYYRSTKAIDLEGMGRMMERFLADTRDRYYREMDAWCRDGLGIPLRDARRCDGAWLVRLREYDGAFPSDRMVSTLDLTLRGLGIDLHRQDNAHLDLEPRPLKRPRAFCSPIRIPQEVYLVVLPRGGYDDYRALFHEAGHLEHFAGTAPELAFEYRWMGDNSVTEGYAFTLEHLMLDPAWIERYTPVGDPTHYLARAHLLLLFMLRRYAAKILYELELHRTAAVPAAMASRYVERFTDAVGFRYAPEEYLVDVDEGFYCAQYLRAWFFDGRLTAWLRRRFGAEWWAEPAAGSALKALWADGQRRPADELVASLDGSPLTPEPLLERILAW
ncbi:MAG: hypothetical protein E6J01_16110 [Chloroflexi bacterium]|nr:MAG: hypothetical protein E6J01_16110 [Chloroflexota bacterium]